MAVIDVSETAATKSPDLRTDDEEHKVSYGSMRMVCIEGLPENSLRAVMKHIVDGDIEEVTACSNERTVKIKFYDYYNAYRCMMRFTEGNAFGNATATVCPTEELEHYIANAHGCGATRVVKIGYINTAVFDENEMEKIAKTFGPLEFFEFNASRRVCTIGFYNIRHSIAFLYALSKEKAFANTKHTFLCETQNRTFRKEDGSYMPNVEVLKEIYKNNKKILDSSFAVPSMMLSVENSSSFGFHECCTLYIGVLPNDTTLEDVCNSVVGGSLCNIRIIRDKKCAFVTFVDPFSATAFYAFAAHKPITINNTKVRVGWGRPDHIQTGMIFACYEGATRSVAIKDKTGALTPEKAAKSLRGAGEIESAYVEDGIVVVNFTSILDGFSAYKIAKRIQEYSAHSIGFAADRCSKLGAVDIMLQLQMELFPTI